VEDFINGYAPPHCKNRDKYLTASKHNSWFASPLIEEVWFVAYKSTLTLSIGFDCFKGIIGDIFQGNHVHIKDGSHGRHLLSAFTLGETTADAGGACSRNKARTKHCSREKHSTCGFGSSNLIGM
jgi:hypothetical protein